MDTLLSYFQVVTELASCAGAIGALVASLRNHKIVAEIKLNVNGKLEAALESARIAAAEKVIAIADLTAHKLAQEPRRSADQ